MANPSVAVVVTLSALAVPARAQPTCGPPARDAPLSARQVAGLVSATAGATGLVLAAHWDSPLNERQRYTSALVGAGLMSLAIPLVMRPRCDDQAGAAAPDGGDESGPNFIVGGDGDSSNVSVGGGVGYRLGSGRVALAALGRYAVLGDRRGESQLVAGLNIRIARLPIADLAVGVNAGAAWSDTASPTRAVADIQPQLQLRLTRLFRPTMGALFQRVSDGDWRVRVLLGATFSFSDH